MASLNKIRLTGYVLKNPMIANLGIEGEEKAIFSIRTIRRDLDSYYGAQFQDVMIFYDGMEFMNKIKKIVQFDMVEIKGVFNVLTINKASICTECGKRNVKHGGVTSFVYPLAIYKINSLHDAYLHDEHLPERMLHRFSETSNEAEIIGTVVSDPEMMMLGKKKNIACCKYRLGIDRKYFIKTQSNLKADYPWVYSYGQHAERDYRYLKKGSVVLIDGFVQKRSVESTMQCEYCGEYYQYKDAASEFVPYSVEYLQNFLTEEDIIKAEESGEEIKEKEAMKTIFEEI